MGHKWKKNASCSSFHLDKKDAHTKQKSCVLRQKHQVVHDHYSFESLKTTRSSTAVQLSKVCPRGNGGSPVLIASRFSSSTMLMLKLPNALSTDISLISKMSNDHEQSGISA